MSDRGVGGIITIFDPDLPHAVEVPTFTCRHHGGVGRVTAHLSRSLGRALPDQPLLDTSRDNENDDGGWCFRCGGLICRRPECADHDDRIHPYFARMGFGW